MKGQDEIQKALALCPGDSLECEQDGCPYWDVRLCVPELHIDALELLKEHETELQKGRYYSDVFDIGYKAGKESIVRCKDCKWLLECENGELQCEIKQGWFPVKPYWFCADGERRTDERTNHA